MDLRDAANAAVQFVTALEEAVDVTLLDFDTSIRLGRFTRDELPAAVRAHPDAEGGRRAPRCTTRSACTSRAPRARGGQHVLLMYTDGGDSRAS